MIIAALCVAAGVVVLFVLWAKAAQLLNARSDSSVLLGCVLILAALLFLCAFVYFVLTMLVFKRAINDAQAKHQAAIKDANQPASLFSETINSVEHLNETDKSKLERK